MRSTPSRNEELTTVSPLSVAKMSGEAELTTNIAGWSQLAANLSEVESDEPELRTAADLPGVQVGDRTPPSRALHAGLLVLAGAAAVVAGWVTGRVTSPPHPVAAAQLIRPARASALPSALSARDEGGETPIPVVDVESLPLLPPPVSSGGHGFVGSERRRHGATGRAFR
jgi:hypothetical protein